MGKALPFPPHKHPPRGAGLLSKLGSAASQATAATGEDQGEIAAEAPPGEDSDQEDADGVDGAGSEIPKS